MNFYFNISNIHQIMTSLIYWMYNKTCDITNWFLYSTGLYSKNIKLIILGLDNAGKTSLLHLLSQDIIKCHSPTRHPTTETINIGKMNVTAVDMGGHMAARRLWKNYYDVADCIIYVIDASDQYRFPENKTEFQKILTDSPNMPIIVLGNKIDKNGAVSKTELKHNLGISEEDNIKVFMCSVVKRAGIKEPFEWLDNNTD